MKNIKVVIIAFMLVAFVFAISVLVTRYKVEKSNNQVQVTIDMGELVDICSISNISLEEGLNEYSQKGTNGIFYEIFTLKTLQEDGLCNCINNIYALKGNYDYDFINKILTNTFGNKVEVLKINNNILIKYDPFSINEATLELVPLGFDNRTVKILNDYNYNIVARIPAFKGAKEETINLIFNYLKENNISQICFLGDSVLGFKSLVKFVAENMNEKGLYFGKIEFADQKGGQVLSKLNDKYTIQVHSVTAPEMATLSDVSLIERFTKAVRERGIRLVFIRMIDMQSGDALANNLQFIEKIKNNICKAGYEIGTPKEVANMPEMTFNKAWASLGVGCLVFALLNLLYVINYKKNIALLIVCLLGSAGMSLVGGTLLKLLTLILACAAPILAILFVVKNEKIKNIYLKILYAFGITFYGGILNAALLSNNDFMARNEIFAGIKLAHFIPLLVIAFVLGFSVLNYKESIKDSYNRLKENIFKLMKEPMLIAYVVVGFIILAIVGIMLARSGNDSGMAVSGLELRFRAILDKIVYVRPRTKEFMLGYPCLLLGFWYLKYNNKIVSNILLTVGTIGLVSMFNTFCHIHTPIILGIIRSINGLWCGLLIGIIVLFIIKNLFFKCEK